MNSNETAKTQVLHPGNDGVITILRSTCLFCRRMLIPGDWQWFCSPCYKELQNKTLETLLEERRFQYQVVPVPAANRGIADE